MCSWFWHYMEVSGQLHTLTTLHQRNNPQFPLIRRSDMPQNQNGSFREEKNLFPLLWAELKCFVCQVIQSLYQPYSSDSQCWHVLFILSIVLLIKLLNTPKHEIHWNIIYKFSYYHTVNTLLHNYKVNQLLVFRETLNVYTENQVLIYKYIRQGVEFCYRYLDLCFERLINKT